MARCAAPSACPGAETSIEVDPRTVNHDRRAHLGQPRLQPPELRRAGFRPAVQQAVHRVQSHEMVAALMAVGAPARLRVDQRRPDLRPAQADARVAAAHREPGWPSCAPSASRLYSYAHLPQRFKPQRRIDGRDAAGGTTRCACWPRPSRASSARVTSTSAWTTSRCRRLARRGQAPGPAAPQLPGLQHAARLRPDRPGRLRRSAASAPPTARTPRRWTSTTTP